MSVAKVAIVGRPNVGKSSIFNWLAGIRLAIVDNMAGVTRDRMTYMVSHNDRYFEMIDTGGIGINDVDQLDEEIESQIQQGIQLAHILMFVVDVKDGLTNLDETIARRLRALNKPVLLVANKCDGENWENAAQEFQRLGIGTPVVVSAKNNRNKEELLDALLERLPTELAADADDLSEPEMKIAVVGRRNVGKSTFINTLVQSPRMIVSEIPGTTRDSIDVRFEIDGKTMVAIDTPGLKRGKSIKNDIDFYSDHRAHRTIRYADVVLMFFDCSQRIARIDQQLCGYIEQNHKPCIFVVNKWDKMAPHMPTEAWSEYLRENFASMNYVPIAFITGQDGRNVRKLLNHAQMLFKQSRERVSTGDLNRIIQRALSAQSPPVTGTKRPKIYYATQVSSQPPTIVIKCNDPKYFPNTYRRYLMNFIRDQVRFGEIPIRLMMDRRVSLSAEERSGAEPPDLGMTEKELQRFESKKNKSQDDDEFSEDF
ncbi:MAG: ribosome biogenesis GTPase Der [Pirellulaceae bacterium]